MADKVLSGKVALITGASRGIGAACARQLAEDGADIAIGYHQAKDAAEDVAAQVRALGARASIFQADLGDPTQAAALPHAVADTFGHIDILVNSAALFVGGAIESVGTVERTQMWAVNVHGMATVTARTVAHMPDGGRIIGLGSVAGERAAISGLADYSATKAAVHLYCRSWARELAPRGILVNTVVPSFVQTDMVIPPESDLGRQLLAALPQHRYAEPAEVAAMVGFLAGPKAGAVTGSIIHVDGGWNA